MTVQMWALFSHQPNSMALIERFQPSWHHKPEEKTGSQQRERALQVTPINILGFAGAR